MAKRIAAIIFIFAFITVAWVAVGCSMTVRSNEYGGRLSQEVAGLWGDAQIQQAPELEFIWWTTKIVKVEETDPVTKKVKLVKKEEKVMQRRRVLLDSSDIGVDFDLAHRQKGLLWYSTYLVGFAGDYAYTHHENRTGFLNIIYRFPTQQATYDDFRFEVNGQSDPQISPQTDGGQKVIIRQIPVTPGQKVDFTIAYQSRGLNFWNYSFGQEVNRVKEFSLVMNTNFKDIDFTPGSISPTTKEPGKDGWRMTWEFSNLISGFNIGMDMPKKLNPGPLAGRISLFAPISLLFYFVWIFVISLLKKIDLHPINYLFLGASFFSFHLLFAYTVDHISLMAAFSLSSTVSIFLAVSYLRLAVGFRFAALEAGLAQIVYLVLFSYAHFYEGWTGLIVTVGSIITLFVIMQLTGRINWTEKFDKIGPPQTTTVTPPPAQRVE